ncbi:MAG: NAD(P)H-dependent glycerol-3-phosphate dehydrogenase [Acidimicrobiia bacterium]|nr:NAD(P)H-dependent glycerol-3-phosphate dehydrogenase [Acidimicrobiia bacterium]
MSHYAVIGAGSWGTTVASLIARSEPTVLWARRSELAEAIQQTRMNTDYLPSYQLPPRLEATSDMRAAVEGASVVIVGVPSHGFREVFNEAAKWIEPSTPVVSLTKGVEEETLETMTQIVADVAPRHDAERTGMLTGPNLASEIVDGQPTAAVIAMRDQDSARQIQHVLIGPAFRVYTNDDVIGCELSGAMKNVMAIAAGMSDGLGFGDNTRATLITRALAELTRLGVKAGGRPATFAGLAGMGDLIATCSSPKSRNHKVGMSLAEGRTLEQTIREMRMVAEGVKSTRGVLGLAERHGVEMPIAQHVGHVLYDGLDPKDAVLSLMTREPKAEH